VQGPKWCWEYDTTLLSWHERQSYLQTFWRGYQPINVFGSWVCGDTLASNMLKIDGTLRKEGGVNDRQTITTTGVPTGGTFTLTFNGRITAAIPYNATASQVASALAALTTIGSANNIDCTGGPLPTGIVVRFKEALGCAPQTLTATGALTGGTTPAVAIAHTVTGVAGNPLRMRVETGPFGAFPNTVRVNTIELYLTKGASNVLGHDPDETNAMVEISMSRNGGQSWSNARQVPIGQQSRRGGRARSSVWGQVNDVQGVRWRFDESAGLNFAFMGADMIADKLR
jgi:hypothetical protein